MPTSKYTHAMSLNFLKLFCLLFLQKSIFRGCLLWGNLGVGQKYVQHMEPW